MNSSKIQNEPSDELSFLSPYFLGAYGENNQVLEELLLTFVKEHINWRKDFHPEDQRPISSQMIQSKHYKNIIAKITQELHSLTTKLKCSIPIYNPRYLGKMGSDLMLPALLAQLVTTFYNPNNSVNETAQVTIEMELEVGKQFAELFGFNTDPNVQPCAWGHITSGGSDANYESLWNFRAVKYYPVALVEALKQMSLNIDLKSCNFKKPFDYSPWQLINLSIDSVLDLRHEIFSFIQDKLGPKVLKQYSRCVEENRIEALGPAQFFAHHWKLHQPVVLVPSNVYAFWEKAMRLLGFGSASLIKVPMAQTMRMDVLELERILTKLHLQNIPTLSVVGVLGTLEFGTIDPIHSLVKLQKEFSNKGYNFYLHVDASCGSYLKALFKDESGKHLSQESVHSGLNHFPSKSVYDAFMSLNQVDSITVAPHIFGYLPQGTGGFVTRNREIVKLLNYSEKNLVQKKDQLDLSQLSRFIMDGSKPGANAAAVYFTHKILPLNSAHFGRIVKQTISSAEYFYNKITQLKKKLMDKANICIPLDPDTNLITIAINPVGNKSLTVMNDFFNHIYEALSYNPEQSIQSKPFLGSRTQLEMHYFSEQEQKSLFKLLHLQHDDDMNIEKNSIFILRHSMMNPWLMSENNGGNYLDHYCEYLEEKILEVLKKYSYTKCLKITKPLHVAGSSR